jgi:hypothetical protein
MRAWCQPWHAVWLGVVTTAAGCPAACAAMCKGSLCSTWSFCFSAGPVSFMGAMFAVRLCGSISQQPHLLHMSAVHQQPVRHCVFHATLNLPLDSCTTGSILFAQPPGPAGILLTAAMHSKHCIHTQQLLHAQFAGSRHHRVPVTLLYLHASCTLHNTPVTFDRSAQACSNKHGCDPCLLCQRWQLSLAISHRPTSWCCSGMQISRR